MHTSALSCGLLLLHSEPPLCSNPPRRFGAGLLECGHTGLVPPTQDSAPKVPSKPCSLKHVHVPSCHALGHTVSPSLPCSPHWGPGPCPDQFEPKKHIAMLVLPQAAEETWISCYTAGTGPVPLESLTLDWMAFSSSEGLQTRPVSCFTWISILSDGASISTLPPVAFSLCPQGELLPTQFKVLTGIGTADSDEGAEPAVTETRAVLPTQQQLSAQSAEA